MIVVESVRKWNDSRSNTKRSSTASSEPLALGPVRIPGLIVELIHLVAMFLFGAGCSQLATDFGKYTIGRLRLALH